MINLLRSSVVMGTAVSSAVTYHHSVAYEYSTYLQSFGVFMFFATGWCIGVLVYNVLDSAKTSYCRKPHLAIPDHSVFWLLMKGLRSAQSLDLVTDPQSAECKILETAGLIDSEYDRTKACLSARSKLAQVYASSDDPCDLRLTLNEVCVMIVASRLSISDCHEKAEALIKLNDSLCEGVCNANKD